MVQCSSIGKKNPGTKGERLLIYITVSCISFSDTGSFVYRIIATLTPDTEAVQSRKDCVRCFPHIPPIIYETVWI